MYIGSSIFLIAVGAILRWAVSWEVSGFNVQLAGLIVSSSGSSACSSPSFSGSPEDPRATAGALTVSRLRSTGRTTPVPRVGDLLVSLRCQRSAES